MPCAYRKKYGAEHVLIKLIDSLRCALDEDKFVGTVLMNLSKAFDCIPHDLLIAKMKAYGLSKYACKLMSSYISDRYQKGQNFKRKKFLDPLFERYTIEVKPLYAAGFFKSF